MLSWSMRNTEEWAQCGCKRNERPSSNVLEMFNFVEEDRTKDNKKRNLKMPREAGP